MSTSSIKAVVIGATGPTGSRILGEILKSKNFTQVTVLGRRRATLLPEYGVDQEQEENSGRLIQEVVEFDKLDFESAKQYFEGAHAFFSAIGAKKASVDSETYLKVHRDYATKLAGFAHQCGVKHMLIVSTQGASAGSMFTYMKLKGQADEQIAKLNFPCFSCFRPGMLDRGMKRGMMEKFAGAIMTSMHVKDVAKAMRIIAENFAAESTDNPSKNVVNYYNNSSIWKLCSESS
ncbi:Oxidoreductase HTATIP2 [Trichoplax sp. H2]|nr:Oxidoreductase HTATIP2 [Trichoplax sp. H2]|eukprot:RDD43168.1 Oxidoreductase HTATIP2 [Trichoplax sp. H2]